MIYANALKRTLDSILLISFILAIRKISGRHLQPKYLRMLWLFVALRILIPLQIPIYNGLYATLHLKEYSNIIEEWIQNQTQDTWKQWLVSGSSDWFIKVKYYFLDFWNHLFFQISPQGIFYIIGFSGAAICTFIFILKNVSFHYYIARHRTIYGVKNKLPVYIVHGQNGSCLFGIANSEIYINELALQNTKWCQWIIAHELAHYYARDNWYNLFCSLCVIIQWYNPLVWYAAKAALEDCELACDENVLKCVSLKDYADYGRCLIAMSSNRNSKMLHTISASPHSNKVSLKKRIQRIADYQRMQSSNFYNYAAFLCVSLLYLICIGSGL